MCVQCVTRKWYGSQKKQVFVLLETQIQFISINIDFFNQTIIGEVSRCHHKKYGMEGFVLKSYYLNSHTIELFRVIDTRTEEMKKWLQALWWIGEVVNVVSRMISGTDGQCQQQVLIIIKTLPNSLKVQSHFTDLINKTTTAKSTQSFT